MDSQQQQQLQHQQQQQQQLNGYASSPNTADAFQFPSNGHLGLDLGGFAQLDMEDINGDPLPQIYEQTASDGGYSDLQPLSDDRWTIDQFTQLALHSPTHPYAPSPLPHPLTPHTHQHTHPHHTHSHSHTSSSGGSHSRSPSYHSHSHPPSPSGPIPLTGPPSPSPIPIPGAAQSQNLHSSSISIGSYPKQIHTGGIGVTPLDMASLSYLSSPGSGGGTGIAGGVGGQGPASAGSPAGGSSFPTSPDLTPNSDLWETSSHRSYDGTGAAGLSPIDLDLVGSNSGAPGLRRASSASASASGGLGGLGGIGGGFGGIGGGGGFGEGKTYRRDIEKKSRDKKMGAYHRLKKELEDISKKSYGQRCQAEVFEAAATLLSNKELENRQLKREIELLRDKLSQTGLSSY